MPYKYKYIIIRERPFNKGKTIAQINVSDLNKKDAKSKWKDLEKSYPPDKYTSCLTECNYVMAEFM